MLQSGTRQAGTLETLRWFTTNPLESPTTFVSNIYKYYIAYRLVLESQAAQKQAIEKIKGGAK